MDAGIYSCFVVQTPAIHMIFQVDITESKPVLNPTLALPKSTTSPVRSAHQLLEKHPEESSNKWSSKFTLGAISCVVVIILILFITLTVFYYKKKSKDKCGSNVPSLPNITQHPPQELVYTTVDFKCHHKTSNIYENLNIHNSSSDSDNAVKTQDSVEYATISRVL
ncbi:uncharacterized protein LOC124400289 isoform X2 [Silurus meridionalis]|nr:uncharacterized protein LOC124400289 isoform X2 [Silurus meridionalis]